MLKLNLVAITFNYDRSYYVQIVHTKHCRNRRSVHIETYVLFFTFVDGLWATDCELARKHNPKGISNPLP